ncbi:MAG: hypothetical protein ACTSUE_10910 [Promethearchaeota archaeon]
MFELNDWKPEIDTFLEFKNRIVKKIDEFSKKKPNFTEFFTNMGKSLGITFDESNVANLEGLDPDEGQVKQFLQYVIAGVSLIQYNHEMYISVPDYLSEIAIANDWIQLGKEFLLFNANDRVLKTAEIQEKYYLVLPLIEKIFSALEHQDDVIQEQVILLVLVYKIYTSSLQKNKFMNDVEDFFVLYINHLDVFDKNCWKNPLIDNFHRMLVQVGLMLRYNDLVLKAIKHRLIYRDQIKDHLVSPDMELNLILSIINVNFSIAKNYLQLGDTKNHEVNLTLASQWLDSLKDKFPFTKKAWKLKTKMIRSLGHNALKRSAYSECYLMYLRALVFAYHHKLPKEFDRAIMYVARYQKFFSEVHIASLRNDMKIIPETLSKSHLLFLIAKIFTNSRQFRVSVHLQRLMVEVLEQGFNQIQIDAAIGEVDEEMKEKMEKIKSLYIRNLDFLGNLLVKMRDIDGTVHAFEREAELIGRENPRATIKILMKIGREYQKHSRFKEAFEYGEKAFHLASEFLIKDKIENILNFIIENLKMADLPEKLANYKKLLYQD